MTSAPETVLNGGARSPAVGRMFSQNITPETVSTQDDFRDLSSAALAKSTPLTPTPPGRLFTGLERVPVTFGCVEMADCG